MAKPEEFDIQGHRGARGLAPENTIPAFIRALEIGVRTLEMDVVISMDEQVVVSHEPWFSRTICRLPDGGRIPLYSARRHSIFGMNYEDVACYDAGSLPHPSFPDQKLEPAPKPLLREVIRKADAYADKMGRDLPHYSIETKSRPSWEGRYHPDPPTFTALLIDVLSVENVIDRSIIQSFDVRTLQQARESGEKIRLAFLLTRRRAPRLQSNLDGLGFTPEIYSPDERAVNESLVDRVHEKGMKMIPWTVNDVSRMRRLIEMGCDGFITDFPDRAVPLISQ